ncbi:ejaculatory bulb-specific protein 3-like [Danaus plexippus]|nr:ejaculatory bulb-specific protein 3-like [Danaus plexippus]
MKCVIIIGLALIGVCTSEDKYTDRYDDINVDEILSNKRLFTSYIKCLMDQGRCTPEGNTLKVHVTDAIQNSCSKCTEIQKTKARKVVNYIRENNKDVWDELIKKYDPKDEYKEKYEAFLEGKF